MNKFENYKTGKNNLQNNQKDIQAGRRIPQEEQDDRLERFCALMDEWNPDWDTALIFSKVNQYYFTGTMQDGMLVIKNGGERFYFVRRSVERARDESDFMPICPMDGYRDAVAIIGKECGNTYIETEIVTIAILDRLKKYFTFAGIHSLDKAVQMTRSVKSAWELGWIKLSGRLHDELLRTVAPCLLREGMSESDLAAELFEKMIKLGYQGVSRFSMFQSEMVVGQIGFGESSLYPTCVDGPGGSYGMYPAVPTVGSRERKLKKGDLVFIDVGFGVNGYHSDKTQVYMFGAKPPDEAVKAHRMCIEIEKRIAESLVPGNIPSVLYNAIMNSLHGEFKQNFMGYAQRSTKFLGHGIGLHIDELPIIAKGFDEPFAANMVMALEPKKGIHNIGMVGVEDTYIVETCGGRCITGGGSDIVIV